MPLVPRSRVLLVPQSRVLLVPGSCVLLVPQSRVLFVPQSRVLLVSQSIIITLILRASCATITRASCATFVIHHTSDVIRVLPQIFRRSVITPSQWFTQIHDLVFKCNEFVLKDQWPQQDQWLRPYTQFGIQMYYLVYELLKDQWPWKDNWKTLRIGTK